MSQPSAARPRPRPAARALVRAQSPEERELERCLREIELRQRRAAALRSEVASLRSALQRFEAACHARVGDLLAELRRVGRAVRDYERRLERLRDEPEVTDDSEPDPFAADPDPFADWDDGQAAADAAADDGASPGPTRAAPRRGAGSEGEAKRLYLDLAKRCHPDYAQDDGERRRREALMQRVNEAFRARDLGALRLLARQAEAEDPAFATRPVPERLAWARAELARVDDLLAELREEIAHFRAGEVHRLWRRYEAGEPVLDLLEDDLEARLVAEGRRLDRLTAAYRHARDEHWPASAD